MFGIGKAERLLLMKMISDRDSTIGQLREEIRTWKKQVENERLRAEGAINLLLLRTQKAVLTPNPEEAVASQEKMLESMAALYGSDNPNMTKEEEALLIAEIQKI